MSVCIDEVPFSPHMPMLRYVGLTQKPFQRSRHYGAPEAYQQVRHKTGRLFSGYAGKQAVGYLQHVV